jgi:hypothetical protein
MAAGSAVGEPWAVEHIERDAALQFRQRQRWAPYRCCDCRRRQRVDVARGAFAVQRAARQTRGATRSGNADLVGQAVGGSDHFGSLGVSPVSRPSRMESFFWTSMIKSALISLARRRSTSFSRSCTRRASTAVRSTFGPRLRSNAPPPVASARYLRQVARWDE